MKSATRGNMTFFLVLNGGFDAFPELSSLLREFFLLMSFATFQLNIFVGISSVYFSSKRIKSSFLS